MKSLKQFFRHFKNQKVTSCLSIGSLSLGLIVALITSVWCINEYSFDSFHSDPTNTYRIVRKGFINNKSTSIGTVSGLLGLEMKDKSTAIDKVTRLYCTNDYLTVGNTVTAVKNVYAVDENYNEILNFSLSQGSISSFKDKPNAIIISEDWAKRYFPGQSPIGELVNYKGTREVVAVMQNPPLNSSLEIEAMVRIDGIDYLKNTQWGHDDRFITFLTLHEGTDVAQLEEAIKAHACEMFDLYKSIEIAFHLQPLLDMHLGDKYRFDFVNTQNKSLVIAFGLMAIVVLILGCINFTNLFISNSLLRARAIGVKKVNGAGKAGLMLEFYRETFIYSTVAAIIAIIISELILPAVNQVVGYQLIIPLGSIGFYFYMACLILLVTVIAGTFPALYMTHFTPLKTLREQFKGSKVSLLQKSLLIIQLCASIVFLVSSITIKKQISQMQNMDLGFSKDNVMYVEMTRGISNDYDRIADQLLTHSAVMGVTAKTCTPLEWQNGTIVSNVSSPENEYLMEVCPVKANYFSMMEMPLVAGTNPFEEINDSLHYCIINEAAAALVGGDNVIDQLIDIEFYGQYFVKGVVNNAHTKSLHQKVDPQVYMPLKAGHNGVLMIKTNGQHSRAIKEVERMWQRETSNRPFAGSFLDDDYTKLYREEEIAGKLASWLMLIAFFITITGLFGIARFAISRRTKEIGVRKVNGATVAGLVVKLNGSFVRWLIVSFVMACPLAWYMMDKWLEGFAVKTSLSWWIFAITGLATLLISLSTITFHSYMAASQNPVKCLQYE